MRLWQEVFYSNRPPRGVGGFGRFLRQGGSEAEREEQKDGEQSHDWKLDGELASGKAGAHAGFGTIAQAAEDFRAVPLSSE